MTRRVLGGALAALAAAAALAVLASGKTACPPVVAALMPKSGGEVSGEYQAMGFMGKGWGVAKLPYEQRCPCLKNDKLRAQISVELLHYDAEGVELFKRQIDPVEKQTVQNAVEEFTRRQPKPTPANALKPTRTETVPGGTLVLYDYRRQCPGDCVPDGAGADAYAIAVTQLVGVSHTESSSVVVKVEGDIPADLAKAAVQEVFANLKKASFNPQAAGT